MVETLLESNSLSKKNDDEITRKELDESFDDSTDDGISWDSLGESFETWIIDLKNSVIEGLLSVLPVSMIQILANNHLLDNIDRTDPQALAEIPIVKWQQIDVREIPTELISEIPDILIKNMSIEQLSDLSPNQIKHLSPTQVGELSSEQLSSFGENIGYLSDSSIKRLSSEQLHGLAESGNLQYINPDKINLQSLKGWDDYTTLPKEYISHIPAEEFKTINLNSFTPEQLNNLKRPQIEMINSFELKELAENGLIANLNPDEFITMKTMHKVPPEVYLNMLSLNKGYHDIEVLVPEFKGLSGWDDYSSLPPEFIKYIPVEDFKNIDVSTFSKDQILGITKEQLDMLPMDQTIKTYSKYFPEYDWNNIKVDAINGATVGAAIGGVLGAGTGFLVGGPLGAYLGGTQGAIEGATLGGAGSAIGEGARQTAIHNGASENVADAIEIVMDVVAGAGISKVAMFGKEEIKQIEKHVDNLLEAIKNIGKQDVTEIPTINSKLAGLKHEVTDIPFEKKIVDTPQGKVEGVFAKFNSIYDCHIPKESFDKDGILRWSDGKQFKFAVSDLAKNIENDLQLASHFTTEQKELIKAGITPKEFTWHHNEETGILQLVDATIHDQTAHTGGAKLWTSRHENI